MDSLAIDPLVGFAAGLVARGARTASDLAALEARLARAPRVVVVCGAGIAGIAAASVSAREGTAEVVLVVGPPPIRKRLVDGCTLRRSVLETLAAATGTSLEGLMDRLGGKRAQFDGIVTLRGFRGASESRLVSTASANVPDMIGMSSRHGEILQAVRELVPDASRLHLVAGSVRGAGDGELTIALTGGASTLRLPPGRTIVLNATGKTNLLDTSKPTTTPRRWAAAVQVPMRVRGDGPRTGASTAVAFMMADRPLQHMALFTPFADPDSPEAGWYGINTSAFTDETLEAHGRQRVLADLHAVMLEMANQLNLEPVDPEETLGQAVFPADRAFQTPVQTTPIPVVHAGARFSPGVPAINTDGMLAAAVGASAFARDLARWPGSATPLREVSEALRASDRALGGIRARNEGNEWFFFDAPDAARTWAMRCMNRRMMHAYIDDFVKLGLSAS